MIASDNTVLKRKGHRPCLPESDRREIVSSLKPVDRAILGHREADYLGPLRELKPDIVCVGYDQKDIKNLLKKLIAKGKLPIRIVQIRKFGQDGLNSSTAVKKRIAKSLERS